MTIKILIIDADNSLVAVVKEQLLKLEEEVIIVERKNDADIIVSNRPLRRNEVRQDDSLYRDCLRAIAEEYQNRKFQMEQSLCDVFDLSDQQPSFVKFKKETNQLSSRSKRYLKR